MRTKPNSELCIHGHCVSLLKEHQVYTTKYRGKVLVGPIKDYTEFIIRRICRQLDIKIIRMAVMPDHVHIFFQHHPSQSATFIKKKIKGISSRMLRLAFPELVKWCGKSLWSRAAFHGSVGHGSEVVDSYIANQDT